MKGGVMKVRCGLVGVLLLSLVFLTVAPVVQAGPREPVQEEEVEEEELGRGLLEQLVIPLFGALPETKQTAFPYPCLESVLGWILVPLEPCLMALPLTIKDILRLLNTLLKALDDPEFIEALGLVIEQILPVVVHDPYIILGLIDMVINPFSLKLLNPHYCVQDPTIRGICEGIEWSHPCSSCLGSTAYVLAALIYNLPLRMLTPLIPLLPYIAPMLEGPE
jgi:hypothetical protein